MNSEDFGLFIGVAGLVMIILICGASLKELSPNYDKRITESIRECEKELPRNQSCEVVITAMVKSNNEN